MTYLLDSLDRLFAFFPGLKDRGLDVLWAVIILISGMVFARWLRSQAYKHFERLNVIDPTMKPFFVSMIYYGLMIIVITATLGKLGVQTSSIVAVLGTVGLAIGLALQSTLSNVASGIMILFLKPFRKGDQIESGNLSGIVDSVGLFTTNIQTLDGIYVTAPNAQIFNTTIKNFSYLRTRRINEDYIFSYKEDVSRVKKLLFDLISKDPKVLSDPAPVVLVKELKDTGAVLNIRCWTLTEDYLVARSDLIQKIKEMFDREQVLLASPATFSLATQ